MSCPLLVVLHKSALALLCSLFGVMGGSTNHHGWRSFCKGQRRLHNTGQHRTPTLVLGPAVWFYLQGEAGQSAFHSVDVSTDVPRSLITSNRSGGGFAVQYLNVTNVCWSRISDDCVAQNTLDACIFYQVQLLQDARAAAGQQPQGHFSAGQVAAIVVPVTVVGEWPDVVIAGQLPRVQNVPCGPRRWTDCAELWLVH